MGQPRVIIARLLLVKEVENYARHQRCTKDRETRRANCSPPIFTPPLRGSLCQGSRKVGEFRTVFGEIVMGFIECIIRKFIVRVEEVVKQFK